MSSDNHPSRQTGAADLQGLPKGLPPPGDGCLAPVTGDTTRDVDFNPVSVVYSLESERLSVTHWRHSLDDTRLSIKGWKPKVSVRCLLN